MGEPMQSEVTAKKLLDRLFEAALNRAGNVERDLQRIDSEAQSFIKDRDTQMDERPHSPESLPTRCLDEPGKFAPPTQRSEITSRLEDFERGKRGYRPWQVRMTMRSNRKRMKQEVKGLRQRKKAVIHYIVSLQKNLDYWKDYLYRNVQFGVMAVLADYANKKDGESKSLGLDKLNEHKQNAQSLTDFLSTSLESLCQGANEHSNT
jgi:hypothetical protein